MLKAFSIERTLNRNGRLPSSTLKWLMTFGPIRDGLAFKCSERIWFVDATREGDFGCVPIHNWAHIVKLTATMIGLVGFETLPRHKAVRRR